jgi:hypothetical protein
VSLSTFKGHRARTNYILRQVAAAAEAAAARGEWWEPTLTKEECGVPDAEAYAGLSENKRHATRLMACHDPTATTTRLKTPRLAHLAHQVRARRGRWSHSEASPITHQQKQKPAETKQKQNKKYETETVPEGQNTTQRLGEQKSTETETASRNRNRNRNVRAETETEAGLLGLILTQPCIFCIYNY